MKMQSLLPAVFSLAVVFCVSVGSAQAESATKSGELVQIKGEVLDLTCYVDSGARGEKHASCAKKCIEDGFPVGIKTEDGTVYTVVGELRPLNKELAEHAGKVVTLKGKVASRSGLNMLHNAEVVK